MRPISLTEFVDIVCASGIKRAEKVQNLKDKYDFKADFYKRIRETIIKVHEGNLPKSKLDEALSYTINVVKKLHFEKIINGYKKWWANKNISWFVPPDGIYKNYNVKIQINPELGLIINGQPHVIKLYFRTENLAKDRIKIITNLMSSTVSKMCDDPDGTIMGVLDIRQSKLFTSAKSIPELNNLVDAELSYIATLLKLNSS